jgi:hypothetical protein
MEQEMEDYEKLKEEMTKKLEKKFNEAGIRGN